MAPKSGLVKMWDAKPAARPFSGCQWPHRIDVFSSSVSQAYPNFTSHWHPCRGLSLASQLSCCLLYPGFLLKVQKVPLTQTWIGFHPQVCFQKGLQKLVSSKLVSWIIRLDGRKTQKITTGLFWMFWKPRWWKKQAVFLVFHGWCVRRGLLHKHQQSIPFWREDFYNQKETLWKTNLTCCSIIVGKFGNIIPISSIGGIFRVLLHFPTKF